MRCRERAIFLIRPSQPKSVCEAPGSSIREFIAAAWKLLILDTTVRAMNATIREDVVKSSTARDLLSAQPSTNRRWSDRFFLSVADQLASLDLLTVTVILGASALAGLILLTVRPDPTSLQKFTPEHVSLFGMIDSRGQRLAYFSFFAVTVIGATTLAIIAPSKRKHDTWQWFVIFAWILLLGFAAVTSLASPISLGAAVLSLGLATIATCIPARSWVVFCAVVLIAVLTIGPGWLLSVYGIHPFSDYHYSLMFLQGDQVAAGRSPLGEEGSIGYGIFWPLVLGIGARAGNAFSLGGLIRLVQVGQTLCFAGFLFAAWRRTVRSASTDRWLAVLIVALSVAPFLTTVGDATTVPNQSGLRFLMLPLAAIAANYYEEARPWIAGMLMGALGCIALLYNFETGVAVVAGLGLAWMLRVRGEPLPGILASAVLAAASAALIIGVLLIAYYFYFGSLPFPKELSSNLKTIGLFMSGYGGMTLQSGLVAALIAVHAAYLFVGAVRALLNKNYAVPNLSDVAIATMILVFFPYYANRGATWNLWTLMALYSLILAPLIATRGKRLIPLLATGLVIIPTSATFLPIPAALEAHWRPGWRTGCADGVELGSEYCAHLAQRAQTLRELSAKDSLIWSTFMPMITLHMSKLPTPLASDDLYNMAPTQEAFDQLVQKIKNLRPSRIVFDDPKDPFLGIPAQVIEFNQRLMRSLGDYCSEAKLVGGWQVYERSRC
jgi:hypothetical protein